MQVRWNCSPWHTSVQVVRSATMSFLSLRIFRREELQDLPPGRCFFCPCADDSSIRSFPHPPTHRVKPNMSPKEKVRCGTIPAVKYEHHGSQRCESLLFFCFFFWRCGVVKSAATRRETGRRGLGTVPSNDATS